MGLSMVGGKNLGRDAFIWNKLRKFHQVDGRFKFRFLMLWHLFTLMIPLALLILDLAAGQTGLVFNYLAAMTGILISGLVVWRSGRSEPWLPLVFLLMVGGLFCTLFLPGGRGLHLFILFCSAPVLLQLGGSLKGLGWTLGVFAAFWVFWFAAETGWVKMLIPPPTPQGLVLLSIIYLTETSLLYYGIRQYEGIMGRLIHLHLYYPVTQLPRRQSLSDDVVQVQKGVLAFVHCENQRELALVQGDSFNELLMTKVAENLRRYCDRHDLRCYQLRDNEFAVLQTFENIEEAGEGLWEQLHDTLEAISFPQGIIEMNLHVSIGAAVIDREWDNEPGNPLNLADQALQSALKFHEPVHFYNKDLDDLHSTVEKLKRFSLLKRNLETRGFEVFFQPIVDARTFRTVWYEALLRITDTNGKLTSIYPYLSIAELTGQMPRLTRFVIEKASEFIARRRLPVSVNLSVYDIQSSRIADLITVHARKHGAGSFILEFLERGDLRSSKAFPAFLEKTRACGCLTAMDDFGAGFANIATLLDLPMDIVKLDGELVQKSKTDPKALTLIRTVTAFCKESGLRVVAEHIDESQIKDFRQMGVDYFQGFFFGMPEPESLLDRDEVDEPVVSQAFSDR